MSQRPPRDLDWIPDNSTGISVPNQTKQDAGWLVEKPARQFFNYFWNRLSRWVHFLSGQSEEWIVIDSTNTNEKDYNTLVAYIADSPAAGDKVLVKEDQTVTAQAALPANITLKFLDGSNLLCATNIATSVLKLGSNPVIEGVLNIVLSQTGTTAKAVEIDGDNATGKINVDNSSTGILTTAYHINAGKTGNRVSGIVRNGGGGTLTNVIVNNSGELSNVLIIIDEPNNAVITAGIVDLESVQTLTKKILGTGTKIALGSDADGDIYYRDAGILKRLPKGTNENFLSLKSGIPSWQKFPSFSVHRNDVTQDNITGNDKIEWTHEDFDTNNDFDPVTSFRFTPTVAGKYLFTAAIGWVNCTAGDLLILKLYKNGAGYKFATAAAEGAIDGITLSVVVDANGTTDYFEIFANNSDRDTSDLNGVKEVTYFTGCRIS